MDDTGMSHTDKIGFVEDVLVTWGEEAAREFAERYDVDLDALNSPLTKWLFRPGDGHSPS
jgi:hypothetical protein